MATGLKTVDDNTKLEVHKINIAKNQLAVVKEFKNLVAKENKSLGAKFGTFFKSFSLNSLASKLGNMFNRTFMAITNPFKAIGDKIGSVFTSIKNTVTKPINAVKTLMGRSDEQLKAKFYRLWWNPKKVAKIWGKELYNMKNLSPKAAQKKAGVSEVGGALLSVTGRFFAQANKFLTKALIKTTGAFIVAFHSTIGPYVLLIIGAIVLLSLLFKDQLKEIIPVFGKILNVVADMLDQIKGPLGKIFVKLLDAITDIPAGFGKLLGATFMGIANVLEKALGLITGILSTVNSIWSTLNDIIEVTLKPIKELAFALQPVLEGFVNLVKRFVDNPVDTAVQVGKSVVSGIKGLVGGLFGSGARDEAEGGSILDNLFSKIGDGLLMLKDWVAEGGLKALLKETVDWWISRINNIKVFDTFKNFLETETANFHQQLYRKIDDIAKLLDKKGISSTNSGLSGSILAAGTAFATVTDSLKNFLGFGNKEKSDNSNAFDELIKGFETMRKDSVALLETIKDSLIRIEQNKIQIGGVGNSNIAEASDSKKTNNLQNVTLNYQVDLNRVIEKMDETNRTLNGILTNTSLNEMNERKLGSVWSI